MIDNITGLVLTYNEEPNIARTLQALGWLRQIIVVDSFSTDATESIARSFPNVRFIQRSFDSFASQCNFGLEQITTNWVLSLDADYFVTAELREEISQLSDDTATSAYSARFRYCVFGRPLRGSLYPSRSVLFRKSAGHYVQDGHAHRLVFDGMSTLLRGVILHDDRKSLTAWLDSQRRYTQLEAQKLLSSPTRPSSWADRIRRSILPAAPAAFFYTLLFKQCIFDGWPGWYYALQRSYAELLLSLELLDFHLHQNTSPDKQSKVFPNLHGKYPRH